MRFARALLLGVGVVSCTVAAEGAPVGSSFTYQGFLANASGPVTGLCDGVFNLYDTANGAGSQGTMTVLNIPVTAGVFTVTLDFGGVFTGNARWLEIQVRCPAGSGAYTALGPRQAVLATPHAMSLRPGALVNGVDANPTLTIRGGTGIGLYGESSNGAALFGMHSPSTGTEAAVRGVTNSTAANATAVVGIVAPSGAGAGSAAVSGTNQSTSGNGVGISGVHLGSGDGVSGYVIGAGRGVYGRADAGKGVYGLSTTGIGVDGKSTSSVGVNGASISNAGVAGDSESGYGVSGFSTSGAGVHGTSGSGIGVQGSATSGSAVQGTNAGLGLGNATGFFQNNATGAEPSGIALYARNQSGDSTLVVYNSSTGDLIRGFSGAGFLGRFRVTNAGSVYADGSYNCGLGSGCFNTGTGADLAERIDVTEPLQPGDVVEIDPSSPGQYRRASSAASRLVAGVVSTTPAMTMNNNDLARTSGTRTDTRPLIALVGTVPVKASAENGAIRPGDLLIAASMPGYAMRGDDRAVTGTVIGKALTPLDAGTGTVSMLVMLR